MRISFVILSLALLVTSGCLGPGYATFAPSDARDHAVVEPDMRYLTDTTKGECFSVSALNGIPLDQFTDRRVQRDSQGRLVKVFVLVPPGRYEMTFGYFRNSMYLAGRDNWFADVTKSVDLTEHIYRVNGRVENEFASLWVESETGEKITPVEKALIKKNPRRVPLIIPIPIR